MICPRCTNGSLAENGDRLCCNACGLRRRPDDRVIINRDSECVALRRNIGRTAPGTKVEIMEASPGLKGKYGQFKGELPVVALRSETGFIIATSRSQDDLVLLIAEHDWQIDDEKITKTVEALCDDNNA